MFSRIQTFFYAIFSDEGKKRYVLLAIFISVVVILLIGIVVINSRDPNTDQESNTPSIVSKKVQVNDFNLGQGLEQVYNFSLLNGSLIAHSGDNVAFITTENELIYNNNSIPEAPSILPYSLYLNESGLIINSLDKSYLYRDSTIVPFIENAYSIVPGLISGDTTNRSIEGYMFLVANERQVNIFESTDIFRQENMKQVAQFTMRDEKRFAEIRVINDEPYLFVYSSPSRTGEVDIWYLNRSNRLVRSASLTNIESLHIGKYGVVYTQLSNTPTELSLYSTELISYQADPIGRVFKLNIQTRIAESNVYGSLYAERCIFDSSTSITCLIKEDKNLINEIDKPDKIMRYDFVQDKISYSYSGVLFSGNSLYQDQNEQLIVIGQLNNIAYKLDSSKK